MKDKEEKHLPVTSVNWKGCLKQLTLSSGEHSLRVPRSACVTKGDLVKLIDNAAWVICRNGEAQILPPYVARTQLTVGGLQIELSSRNLPSQKSMKPIFH